MPAALLEMKFYVPRLRRGPVSRPRLSERLDRGTASKLMLVSAPAGFGKTTLLTEWLAAGPAASADERLAAWLSLALQAFPRRPAPAGPTPAGNSLDARVPSYACKSETSNLFPEMTFKYW